MSLKRLLPLVLGLFALHVPVWQTVAQWSTDPAVNNLICAAPDTQSAPFPVPDGTGGAIIVWEDRRSGLSYDIYAQRITNVGAILWPTNGVVVSSAARNQRIPHATSDGAGGAIIVWQDFRSDTADIYAQRLNTDGAPQWTANGLVVCDAANDQRLPRVVRSGAGNAIIAWQDKRHGTDYDIYAQRVSAAGVALWATNGLAICAASGDQDGVRMISDGAGGAIIAWQDHRNGNDYDIYAQRITSAGASLWGANGLSIVTASGDQLAPRIASDGSKGAIITWQDFRNGSNFDVFAQRIDSAGIIKWTADGIVLSAATDSQDSPIIENDGEGGAIIAWADRRTGTDNDIYAQRVNTAGSVLWVANGVPIAAATGDQTAPRIGIDGSGGAIIAWEDQRSGTNSDLYAQRVDRSGNVLWAANGIRVSTARDNQISPNLESDGAQGVIIAWQDYRNGTDFNIYAQRVNFDGSLGGVTAVEPAVALPNSFLLHQNYPNPFNPSTTIRYELPRASHVMLKVFNMLGQEMATLVDAAEEPGYKSMQWDASGLASGVYLYRLQAGDFVQTRKMLIMK